MKRSLLALAVALVACGPEPTSLSRLNDRTLQVMVDLREGSRSLAVWSQLQSDCPTLDAVATMNGVALERVWEGGMHQTIGGGSWGLPQVFDMCFPPEWKLPDRILDEPVTEFEVHDGTGRLLFGAIQPGATRTLTWRSPASGAPRWGDLVSFQWTPATDLVGLGILELVAGARSMKLDVLSTPGFSLADGVLTFRLPDAPPDGGPAEFDGELQYQMGFVHPGISHCEPVQGACAMSVDLPDLAPSGVDPMGHSGLRVPISIR